MFRQLPKFVDKRNSLPKHSSKRYRRRPLTSIRFIVIHHSATLSGSAETFANAHIRKGWPGIGYHFVIEKDGTIVWCNDLETISYHVGGHNTSSVGICMIGDFTREKPTKEQLESVYALTKILMSMLNVPRGNVRGHREFTATACPGISMDIFRNELAKYKSSSQSKSNATVHVVQRGDTLWSISQKYNVSVNDLKKWNKISDATKLQIGMKINVKAPNSSAGSTQSKDTYHTVQRGDTLWALSRKYNVTVDDLKRWNNITNENALQVGTKLRVAPSARPYPGKLFRLTTPYMRDGRGEDYIKAIQRKVGVKVDGVYGPQTERAVKEFQKKHGLTPDGIVGPKTWNAMF